LIGDEVETPVGSEEFAELLNGQSCITDDDTHGDGVDGVVAGDHDTSSAVAHDDMFALTFHSEAGALEAHERPTDD
jgi:hypothetical protein